MNPFTLLMFLLFAGASLAAVPWAAICLVISLILLAIAAFIGPPTVAQPAPFYNRINWGWAGMFFLALSLALS